MSKVAAIPKGMHTVTPNLTLKSCVEGLAFYSKAFGAVETSRSLDPAGKIIHASFTIGDSTFYCSDEFPEMGALAKPASFWIYGEDVDGRHKRAVAAGARAAMEPTDAFWGDRFSKVIDPFGNDWTLAQRIKELTPEQMKAAAETFFAEMSKKK